MVQKGVLGKIRVVQAEYPQDWLTTNIEASGQKQAAWRVDPKRSGVGGSTGDIGTHAYNLARFVTGLEEEVARDLHDERPSPVEKRIRSVYWVPPSLGSNKWVCS